MRLWKKTIRASTFRGWFPPSRQESRTRSMTGTCLTGSSTRPKPLTWTIKSQENSGTKPAWQTKSCQSPAAPGPNLPSESPSPCRCGTVSGTGTRGLAVATKCCGTGTLMHRYRTILGLKLEGLKACKLYTDTSGLGSQNRPGYPVGVAWRCGGLAHS
eukprot:765549-Hanusia_phi.AAC.7